jgi:hypothetical protein
MSTRRAKQLIYGALYLVIILIICAGIYGLFVSPAIVASAPPVCTPSTCVPTSTALIVPGALTMFITSPGHYTFLAQATNQSADYGAPELDYAIDLEDASGTLLQSIPAQAFVYPSQTRYVAVLNQVVAQPFDHAVLTITGASWLTSSSMGTIPAVGPDQFAIQNVLPGTASTTISVGGQLVNTSVTTYSQVIVMVIFKDPSGTPVGVSETQLGSVAAGTTQNFSVIYPNEPNVNPAVNQILVYALR